MKKNWFKFLAVLVLVFGLSLVGCSNDKNVDDKQASTNDAQKEDSVEESKETEEKEEVESEKKEEVEK
ncbi:MAG: C4-dicarboxylate ABC transporter substrate-binding protein, partial [Tissierellia bacterium]|nr:C4-dicarboxylate ABC transporter substrate-binding protein [Tissierellia bacterium]